jgi:hypothetical protein
MNTLVIKDLSAAPVPAGNGSGAARALSHEEMQAVRGGRAIAVLVDGRPGGVVDDFQLQMAIFKGDIGVTVV